MVAFVLFLLALWVVFIIIGFIAHALLWLAIIGIIAFFLTALAGAYGRGRARR